MKKRTCFLLAALVLLTGCGSSDSLEAVTREDGSGTRSAFTQLLGLSDLCASAQVTNSTAVMLSAVSGYPGAIGYLSAGSLSPEVKVISVNGILPSEEAVLSGAYPLSRPFLLLFSQEPDTLTADFLAYLASPAAADVIRQAGFIPVLTGTAYTPQPVTGVLRIAGSTSVAPVIEQLAEHWRAGRNGIAVETQQSGSSAGIRSVLEGICQLGLSSRELTQEEAAAATAVTLAKDAIAVIVNPRNPINGLTSGQLRQIYSGAVTSWSQLYTEDAA